MTVMSAVLSEEESFSAQCVTRTSYFITTSDNFSQRHSSLQAVEMF